MASPVPTPLGPIRLVVLPEHCEAVLRHLAVAPTQWEEIAAIVMRDPGLLHALLAAAPLSHRRLGDDLKELLVARLSNVGVDLLRAWLAQNFWGASLADPAARAAVSGSLLVAECAFHLARQTGYRYPDEAYLTGLWYRLAALCVVTSPQYLDQATASGGAFHQPGEHRDSRAPSAALTARLVATCEVPDPVVDALALEQALEEQIRVAHPLVRLLWSARKLARDDWQNHVEPVARVSALGTDEVYSLRTDAGFLAQQYGRPVTANSSIQPAKPTTSSAAVIADTSRQSPQGLVSDPLQLAAMGGLMRGGFSQLEESQVRERFAIACRLLCRSVVPLIIVADDSGALRPMAFAGTDRINDCYAELDARLDDETSVIALALRTGTSTSQLIDAAQPGRSFHDWHVSRWLNSPGFLCLPLNLDTCRGVAVLGVDASALAEPGTRELVTSLCSAAASTVLEAERQRSLQTALSAAIAERYHDHARRIAHEANNPLTVIRSYLDLLAQRHPEDGALSEEMSILHDELDRLGSLIQQGTQTPPKQQEPDHCSVAQVLHDLRALYGEALFATRDIHFELRTSAGLPPVAMPASALKQVLLNLFRNAAEVLQPGGRFSVAAPGQLLSNGMPCVEIRLIDNGPGLPPERLADLFTARPSAKGGEHKGLGLSIANDILRQWHGYILCRSQPGVGTSLQLLVPLANSG